MFRGEREILISFKISDKPDEVRKYYENLLLQEGWEVRNYEDAPLNWTYFVYGHGPYYYFSLRAENANDAYTSVEFRLVTELPID